MIAIITGDIINSKQTETEIWLKILKNELNKYGKTPLNWEIYRGDSFQLETTVNNALFVAISLKASIKQIENIDLRMAIGIGEKGYTSKKITESNGSAFINSGECFESLKKNTLAIKTPFKEFDDVFNIMIALSLLVSDNWSTKSANLVKVGLENQNLNQKDLSKLLNKTQSTISEGFKRVGYDELFKMMNYYSTKISQLC